MAQTAPERKPPGAPALPPLILHPFNDQAGAAEFLEDSRATLMLSGLLPNSGYTADELAERALRSRYLEIRMLYFLGKDLFRWVGQCVEWMERQRDPQNRSLREQSFADLLTRNAPPGVQEKLRSWGVLDFAAIFSRALGLYTAFAQPPPFEVLGREFVLNYHRYADHLYTCYLQLRPYAAVAPGQFVFELYGSGEYSRMLESQWGTA